jgi:hypothetical protein
MGVVTLLAVTVARAVHKYGMLGQIQISERDFPKCKIIYLNHRGPCQNTFIAIRRIARDFSDFFKFTTFFAIEYDQSAQLHDQSMCRATIGGIVNSGELSLIQPFLDQFTYYQIKEIPKTKCLCVECPFSNFVPFHAIKRKVS